MGTNFKSITWASWKTTDSLDPEHFTIFTAFILKPSWEYPVASAAMTIRRGTKKILLRMSYESLRTLFNVPEEYRERLDAGHRQAIAQMKDIIKQQKVYHKTADLSPGSCIVRTDTGEIIAEAERIMREAKKEEPS